jgi:hypothetical protein
MPSSIKKAITSTFFCLLCFSCFTDPGALKDANKGFNISGEPASCAPMDENTICSTVYTDEDRWADKCRNTGAIVTRCSCHTYVCSEKVAP